MAIIIYPPTDYIITEKYMDKVITTDSASETSPVPEDVKEAGGTVENSSVVVLSKDTGFIDDSFLNYDELTVSISNTIVNNITEANDGNVDGDSYPPDSIVVTDEDGKIYESAIPTLTDEEITEIFNSVEYP